jgi:hypothetical protein
MMLSLLGGCQNKEDERGYIMDPQNTYVVLFEKDNYPDGYSDLYNDFLNISQLESEFITIGVPEDHVYIKKDDLSREDLESSIDWIHENAPEDALIFAYVGSHGRYLSNEVKWNDFFPELWTGLSQPNKILIVDSCNSGKFTKEFEDNQASGITYGIVQANELNWWEDECDNNPIVGGIWVHYFIEALHDQSADINTDNAISFSEIHTYANSNTQEYMQTYVFSIPEYLDMYENAGYFPTRTDAYPNAIMYDHIDRDIIMMTY